MATHEFASSFSSYRASVPCKFGGWRMMCKKSKSENTVTIQVLGITPGRRAMTCHNLADQRKMLDPCHATISGCSKERKDSGSTDVPTSPLLGCQAKGGVEP